MREDEIKRWVMLRRNVSDSQQTSCQVLPRGFLSLRGFS